MTSSKPHENVASEPLTKVAEVRRRYGTLAPEYAKVRAETAAEAGSPEGAAQWQRVQQELEIDGDRAA